MARPTERATAGGSGIKTTFVPLADHAQDAVAVLLAEVGDVQGAGLEDAQAEEAEQAYEGEVARGWWTGVR